MNAARRISVRNLHDRYWWMNIGDLLSYYADRVLMRRLCGASHPRIKWDCNKRLGHSGDHRKRDL